jgi:hypothetical protein
MFPGLRMPAVPPAFAMNPSQAAAEKAAQAAAGKPHYLLCSETILTLDRWLSENREETW